MPTIENSGLLGQASLRAERLPHVAFTSPPVQLSEHAIARAARYGREYAVKEAPRSPNPKLSGNHLPEQTAIRWLKDRYKCNQFVGDVLYSAGFEMPSYKMADGSEHYVNAEALKKFGRHFDPITSFTDLQAGDLIVLDRINARGENGAHVEIVTRFDSEAGLLEMVGARRDGASIKNQTSLYRSLQSAEGNLIRDAQGRLTEIIVLRPKLLRRTLSGR